MQQKEPVVLEQLVNLFAERAEVGEAHVFDHLEAKNLVELGFGLDVSVVLTQHPSISFEPALAQHVIGVVRLLLGKGDSRGVHAVVLGAVR